MKVEKIPGTFWEWSAGVKPRSNGLKVHEVAGRLGLKYYSLEKIRKGHVAPIPSEVRLVIDDAFEDGEGESPWAKKDHGLKRVPIVALPPAAVIAARNAKNQADLAAAREAGLAKRRAKGTGTWQEPEEDEPVATASMPESVRQAVLDAGPPRPTNKIQQDPAVSAVLAHLSQISAYLKSIDTTGMIATELAEDTKRRIDLVVKVGEDVIDKLQELRGLFLGFRTPSQDKQANGAEPPAKTIHEHEAEVTEGLTQMVGPYRIDGP